MGKTRYPYVQMKRAAHEAFNIRVPKPAYPPPSRQYRKEDYGMGETVRTVTGAGVAMVGIGTVGAMVPGITGVFQK